MTGGRKDIMKLFDPTKNYLFHPGTYNNNVLTMNVGMVGLEIYIADEVDRLNVLGDKLKTTIQQILIDEKVYLTFHATHLSILSRPTVFNLEQLCKRGTQEHFQDYLPCSSRDVEACSMSDLELQTPPRGSLYSTIMLSPAE
jgi:glutamate-1-semialdehyde aminotransferase